MAPVAAGRIGGTGHRAADQGSGQKDHVRLGQKYERRRSVPSRAARGERHRGHGLLARPGQAAGADRQPNDAPRASPDQREGVGGSLGPRPSGGAESSPRPRSSRPGDQADGRPVGPAPRHASAHVLVEGVEVPVDQGASPGRAAGRVRIVGGPADFDAFQPGEVLVAQATAPAWTPLFGRAAAVVTDGGTLAAHASLVAREYGIPAVVGDRSP
jgi:phosphohistidine swiveling domain-containing protein